jgi:hypothetical protein
VVADDLGDVVVGDVGEADPDGFGDAVEGDVADAGGGAADLVRPRTAEPSAGA